ncbi:CDP-glycerol glycerophosphotransferase family protein [Shewanella intestini]|uniref:CDP-glycerol--glycerophosphate glycerophosphotransferase n=1 Tax=Shewanella intestini TaxID=2017544 RepID=A0ABS5HZ22_9GAMM|nr:MULTISPECIES: CDP-glycerol glycerophosphotransferase family protein [Shewanella]MBR9726813.1 CDP-glycerol--glycerophosphate glycerophosphotransferase [Shewanella intestini]MRG34621.1 CDP-glycerol--glycerophosphate glycerophosphotransferase [Shewanella sp. XMDDZSB0408]
MLRTSKTSILKASVKIVIVAILSFIAAKVTRQQKAVCGSYRNQFSDNAKYLFLHWHQSQTMNAIWISGDKLLVKRLTEQGLMAFYRWSAMGIYHALTAKYYVYNSYIGDVNQYFANGAIKINLWHGSPLKRIEFDINNGPMQHIFHPQTQLEKLIAKGLYHQQLTRADLMLAPSELVATLFSSAFKLPKASLLKCGNPRTDYYQRYSGQDIATLHALLNLSAQQIKQTNIILYAPSWRDSALATGQNPYTQAIDFEILNNHLMTNNQIMLLRFHPNEAHFSTALNQYRHIVDITDWEDIYGILSVIDVLISDYSSIYIDALPNHCDIAFYKFDKDHYQTQCRRQYPFTEELPSIGPTLTHFEELMNYLTMHSYNAPDAPDLARNSTIDLFWEYATNSSFDCIDHWVAQQQSKSIYPITPSQQRL